MAAPMWVKWIYGLVDPRDGRVRYVGQSEDPDRRFRQHLRDGLRLSDTFGLRHPETGRYMGNPLHGRSDCERWLEELAACRLAPKLVLLQTVRRPGWHVIEAAHQAEQAWAHHLRAWGVCDCFSTPVGRTAAPVGPRGCAWKQDRGRVGAAGSRAGSRRRVGSG
jgi:hypothetical protein